jgi:hypothetical protein
MVAPLGSEKAKIFTVEEANAALPLVRAIVADLTRVAREVIERRHRLSVLLNRRGPEVRDPYSEELAQIEEELDKDIVRLQEFVVELRQLGVEPKSASEGLVDFPAIIDGRMVYLCWRLGESEVQFWHELTAGFQERQPLTRFGPLPRRLSDTTQGM